MEKFKVKLPDGESFLVQGDAITYSSVSIEITVNKTIVASFPIGTTIVNIEALAKK